MKDLQKFLDQEYAYVKALRNQTMQYTDYAAHYRTLSEEEQGISAYLVAAEGLVPDQFMRILTRDDIRYPIEFCGWAGDHSQSGPAFRINRSCFQLSQQPRIFYADDDMHVRNGKEYALEVARCILPYSSGLSDPRVGQLPLIGSDYYALSFALNPRAIKRTVNIGGEKDTEELGGYVLALHKTGEFQAWMGEHLTEQNDGILLHGQSFCMK